MKLNANVSLSDDEQLLDKIPGPQHEGVTCVPWRLVPYKVTNVRIPMGMSLSAALLPNTAATATNGRTGASLLLPTPPQWPPGSPDGNTLSDTRATPPDDDHITTIASQATNPAPNLNY